MEDTVRLSTFSKKKRSIAPQRLSMVQADTGKSGSISRLSIAPVNAGNAAKPIGSPQKKNIAINAIGSVMKSIVSFLSTHNYNGEISIEILKKLNDNVFCDLVSFLLRFLDPRIPTDKDIKDILLDYLRSMNYPIVVTKSMLAGLTSQSSRNTVLNALKWLIDVITCMESARDCYKGREINPEEVVISRIKQAYDAYVTASTSDENRHIESLEKDIRDRNDLLKKQKEGLQQKMGELQDEVSILEDTSKEIENLTKIENEYNRDIKKFEYVVISASHDVDLERISQENAKTRLDDVNKQLEEVKTKREAIKEELSKQEIDEEKLKKIQEEVDQSREQVNRVMNQKQIAAMNSDHLAIQINEKILEIDQLLVRYHDALHHIGFLPSTSPLANSIDYTISIHHGVEMTKDTIDCYEQQIAYNPILKRLEMVLVEYEKAIAKAVSCYSNDIASHTDMKDKKRRERDEIQKRINERKEKSQQLQAEYDTLFRKAIVAKEEKEGKLESLKFSILQSNVMIDSLKRDIAAMKQQMDASATSKNSSLQIARKEELSQQESVILLLDAISKFTVSVDSDLDAYLKYATDNND